MEITIKYPLVIVVMLSIVFNCVFCYLYNPAFYYAKSIAHAQVGYSITNFNSTKVSKAFELRHKDATLQAGKLVDLADVDSTGIGKPEENFAINDTIGFGVLLGLIWKLTGSFCYRDVQVVHIIIFTLSFFLYFFCALWLFGSQTIAFACSMAHLFFFPILAMNVQPVRDIWAYYGALTLLFIVIGYLQNKLTWQHIVLGSLWIAVCQSMRPSLFMALLTMTGVLVLYSFFYKGVIKKTSILLSILWGVNILVFWAPFIAFNKLTYNRYIVGPAGQDLLEGLGEFPNQWGYKLDDQWIAEYVGKKYNVVYGTQEFDDAARAEFNNAYTQNPVFFYCSIVRRTVQLLLPGLPWIYYTSSPYKNVAAGLSKITAILFDRALLVDFLARHVYIRLYLFLGYLGALVLLLRRKYWIVFLVFGGIVLGGLGKLPSHIEYRYIVPFYWATSFFVGYFVYAVCEYFGRRYARMSKYIQ